MLLVIELGAESVPVFRVGELLPRAGKLRAHVLQVAGLLEVELGGELAGPRVLLEGKIPALLLAHGRELPADVLAHDSLLLVVASSRAFIRPRSSFSFPRGSEPSSSATASPAPPAGG